MEILKPGCIFKHILMTSARLEFFANKHFLATFNLTITSLKILDILMRNKAVTPTFLMQKLSCTKSNITQRLKVMEKNGLIKRSALIDKRKVGVGITDSGRKIMSNTVNSMKKKGFEMEKKLGIKETIQCHVFLDKMNDLLDQYEYANSK